MIHRFRAFAIHLTASIVAVSLVLAFVYFVCFPQPLYQAMDVGRVLLIIAVVDVTLGPLLTFAVFKQDKKQFRRDLGVIALLQLLALGYGFNTAFQARPAFAVFFGDRFHLIPAVQIPKEERQKYAGWFLPMTGPEFVGVEWPHEPAEAKRIALQTIANRTGLPQMVSLYQPLTAFEQRIKQEWMPVETLINGQPDRKIVETQKVIESTLAKLNLKLDEVSFIPLQGRGIDLSVLLREADYKVLAIVPVYPWAQPNS